MDDHDLGLTPSDEGKGRGNVRNSSRTKKKVSFPATSPNGNEAEGLATSSSPDDHDFTTRNAEEDEIVSNDDVESSISRAGIKVELNQRQQSGIKDPTDVEDIMAYKNSIWTQAVGKL